ncbi:MAG TPA: hypothetical protein VGD60_16315 [Candidatus Acidoferrales bacterium]
MRKPIQVLGAVCLLFASASGMAVSAMAAPPPATERYLHVKVEDSKEGESVNVNLPLSIAEKILPTVNKGNLHNGTVNIGSADLNGIDVKGLLEAIRTAPDNEFVTVKQKDQDVRIAKSNGNIIVHVRSTEGEKQNVDITIPLKVVDALFSTAKDNELNIVAALHELSDAGDALLITVQDTTQHVRIWVDSRTTSE